jgi:lipopolysaccharide export system protein LptA
MRPAPAFTALALVFACIGAAPAGAQPAAGAKDRPAAFGGLSANKDPINIDADRLDVFDKESRAVFAGNVVAVQGDTTMKCTTLTVFYEQNRQGAGGVAKTAAANAQPGENSIKKIDCKGPVTIVSKTQVATGDNATFDRVVNRVLLLGNVALTDGPNVTRGEKLVYDLNSGVANMETAPGGRVKALFVPGSNPDAAAVSGAKPQPQTQTQAQPQRRATN